MGAKRRPVHAHCPVEIGDGQRGIPGRVNAAVDVWRRPLRALSSIHGVVVLVGILAARVEARLRVP